MAGQIGGREARPAFDSRAVTIEQMGRLFVQIEAMAARMAGTSSKGTSSERLQEGLANARAAEADIETKFTVSDPTLQRLFVVLCSRCELEVYRVPRQRYFTMSVRAPKSFVQGWLSPMFEEMSEAMDSWMVEQAEAMFADWETRAPRESKPD